MGSVIVILTAIGLWNRREWWAMALLSLATLVGGSLTSGRFGIVYFIISCVFAGLAAYGFKLQRAMLKLDRERDGKPPEKSWTARAWDFLNDDGQPRE